jgi:hypothetical protein
MRLRLIKPWNLRAERLKMKAPDGEREFMIAIPAGCPAGDVDHSIRGFFDGRSQERKQSQASGLIFASKSVRYDR